MKLFILFSIVAGSTYKKFISVLSLRKKMGEVILMSFYAKDIILRVLGLIASERERKWGYLFA